MSGLLRSLAFGGAAAAAGGIALFAEPAVLLSGPEVAKVAWDTHALAPADFDGDGRLDVALINNENAKIVILYQRTPGEAAVKNQRRATSSSRWDPVVEDSRFEKVSIPADQRHQSMVAADFDGDKRADLALTGVEDALLVKFQAADGTFTKTWKWKEFEPMQTVQHMRTADFNGDSRADLAVLAKGKLLVFLQKAEGGLADPAVYLTGEERVGQLFAEDADRDGRTDLLYLAAPASGEGTLRWRRQVGAGAFSAEVALPYSVPAWSAQPSRDADGRLVLTRVNAKSHLIERHTFVAGNGDDSTLTPTMYNAPWGTRGVAHAIGDFDADGLDDIALADSKSAQVALFSQQPDGTFSEPRTFPSFAGVTAIAAIPGEKGASLAVASRKEGLGISRFADGRLTFPVAIALSGEPVLIAAADGKLAALVEEDRKWRLDTIAGGKVASSRALPALKREPAGIATGDLNGDKLADFVLIIPREPSVILLGATDGPSEPIKETAGIRSQLNDLAPERVALLDLDADGRAEIITAAAGYARSVKLNGTNDDIAIADQFNARQPDDKLIAPAFLDTDNDGIPELIFGQTGGAALQVLKKDSAGVFRAARTLDGIPGDALLARPITLGSAKTPHLLVISRDRFWAAPLTGPRARLELTASYDTDLRNCQYYAAVPADITGDGREEILAFDRNANLLEILAPGVTRGQPWRSLMHFALFEENIRFRGRKGETAVREFLIRDFTGDGRNDLLILVHDRVLLYPQG
jgi:FG-GAP-like repeat